MIKKVVPLGWDSSMAFPTELTPVIIPKLDNLRMTFFSMGDRLFIQLNVKKKQMNYKELLKHDVIYISHQFINIYVINLFWSAKADP